MGCSSHAGGPPHHSPLVSNRLPTRRLVQVDSPPCHPVNLQEPPYRPRTMQWPPGQELLCWVFSA